MKPSKPPKPTPDFPLFAHDSGKWAKKIGGKLRYFGRWADPAGALAEYQASLVCDRLAQTSLTVKAACDLFLTAKQAARDAGKITARSFADYLKTCLRVADHWGRDKAVAFLGPDDFAGYQAVCAARWNLITTGNEIQRVKVLFRWLAASRLTPPAHFGPDFRRASAKEVRRHRRKQGRKLFTASELHLLLDQAGVQMRAMILLGINCGYGPSDCATLPIDAIDIEAGWITYPRPKTEIDRSCALWQRTRKALALALKRRPTPKEELGRLFVLPDGRHWDCNIQPIQHQFAELVRWTGLRGTFYWLRHTFQTVADGAKDALAVKHIMGHLDASMSAMYRENIEESRLQAVSDHVERWLRR
jgi:integrase